MFHPMNGTDFLTAAGERERAEPLLYASMPLRGYTGKARPPFDMHPANTRLRVAPYDVHATLRDLTGLPPRGLGKSLRHPLGKRSCAEAGVSSSAESHLSPADTAIAVLVLLRPRLERTDSVQL